MSVTTLSNQWQDLQSKVRFLKQPSAYPEQPPAVETVETHMSWVFLTGQYAYKLKKPVLLPFLDFSTLETRYQSVDRELKLNRPLAPGVYLEILPLLRNGDHDFKIGSVSDVKHGAPVVDWLLKMKQLPRNRMLDQTLGTNHVNRDRLSTAIEMLTEFYRTTEHISITPAGYREHLRTRIENNYAILSLPGYALDERQLESVYQMQLNWLDGYSDWFEQRVREGRIVDGHGDLRPEHVCLTSPPVIIDRFELNAEERIVDPVDELSFLYMECELLGHPETGDFVLEQYRRLSGDDYPPQLTSFFRSLRACIRARFAAWHLDDPWVRDRERWRLKAAAYLRLAGVIRN
jgi:aminoglycoside phosphotransferase family enzyme